MSCPYVQHAPGSIEGAACWSAAMATIRPGMTTLEMDLGGALAAAREMGAAGWFAPELLAAVSHGMAAALEKRAADTTEQEAEPHV